MADEGFLDAYLDEANDQLQKLNENMIDFENSGDEEALNELFRATHTLKSSSASMEFNNTSDLAHRMEDVFDALRDDEIEEGSELFELLYHSIDVLDDAVQHIEDEGEEPKSDFSNVRQMLDKAGKGEDFGSVDKDKASDNDVDNTNVSNTEINKIEVDAGTLDDLVNAVGELMIVEKKMRGDLSPFENKEVENAMNQFKRLGENIRQNITKARMVPVSQVFARFPRTVRDLSSETGKEINFEMEGTDLRLDRTVLDEIDEPVIHMIRNSVDHGIEKPDVREQKGKPREGNITLEAARKGDKAIITVEDDGRGINIDEVKEKAIEKEMISENEAESMSKREIAELIFDPDFSTTDEVTDLSGRGVGMSVVKQTAERLQGTYDVETERGKGTSFSLELPISLAIIKCFVMKIAGKRFGIPIKAVEHVKRISDDEIKSLEGEDVFVFEDREIPLINLGKRLDLSERSNLNDEGDNITVIVVSVGKQKAGLRVDSVTTIEKFVIKELDFIKHPSIAGSSILPDGTPISILDTSQIIR